MSEAQDLSLHQLRAYLVRLNSTSEPGLSPQLAVDWWFIELVGIDESR
jgi:hypothetical protein